MVSETSSTPTMAAERTNEDDSDDSEGRVY